MKAYRFLFAAFLVAALLPGCRRPHTSTTASVSAPPKPVAVQAAAPPPRLWLKGTMDVPVIMYHDVVPRKEVWFDLTVREFEAQMRSLADADATVVPLSDVVAHLRDGKPLPPRAIALTFDDGTLGNYEHAWPILQRYNFPATFFVHTDYVGVKTTKDHMTWDQLRELKQTGLIDIQPHTASHPEDLRKMKDEAVRAELSKSNAVFEQEMREKARFLAYPSGHADERVARIVQEAGYEAAWNEVRAWDASPADAFHLPRFAPFRLYEVLEAWRLEPGERPEPAWTVADFTVTEQPSSGEKLSVFAEFQAGRWQLKPDGDILLGSRGYSPMPDARQRASIGRPIVVVNGTQVAFGRYQPWMGVEQPALNVLLPDPSHAIVGREWLVHEGQVLDAGRRRRVRGAALLGVLEDGRPFSGRAGNRATMESLGEALIRIGAREAILL